MNEIVYVIMKKLNCVQKSNFAFHECMFERLNNINVWSRLCSKNIKLDIRKNGINFTTDVNKSFPLNKGSIFMFFRFTSIKSSSIFLDLVIFVIIFLFISEIPTIFLINSILIFSNVPFSVTIQNYPAYLCKLSISKIYTKIFHHYASIFKEIQLTSMKVST